MHLTQLQIEYITYVLLAFGNNLTGLRGDSADWQYFLEHYWRNKSPTERIEICEVTSEGFTVKKIALQAYQQLHQESHHAN